MELMKCYSAIKKNTFESVLMRWMKLETILQSEVSQKVKHQYSILTHIFRKMVTMTLYCKTAEETQMWRTVFWTLDSVGEGEGAMFQENSIKTCILSRVKQITRTGWMHETGRSGLVHWDDPEGWDGEEGGRGVQDGGHMYAHGWFMSVYGKNQYSIVK